HLRQRDLADGVEQEPTFDVHVTPVRAQDGREVAGGTGPVIRIRGVVAELDGHPAHGAPDASLIHPRVEVRAGDDAFAHGVVQWAGGGVTEGLDGDRAATRASGGGAGSGEKQGDGAHEVVTAGNAFLFGLVWMRTALPRRAVSGCSVGRRESRVAGVRMPPTPA